MIKKLMIDEFLEKSGYLNPTEAEVKLAWRILYNYYRDMQIGLWHYDNSMLVVIMQESIRRHCVKTCTSKACGRCALRSFSAVMHYDILKENGADHRGLEAREDWLK